MHALSLTISRRRRIVACIDAGSEGVCMSCGPWKPRRNVNGKTSPGSDRNWPSPIRNDATWLWIAWPLVALHVHMAI